MNAAFPFKILEIHFIPPRILIHGYTHFTSMAFASSASPFKRCECNRIRSGCALPRRGRFGIRACLGVPEVSRRSLLLAVGGSAYDMWASRYNLLDGSSSFLPETLGLTTARRDLLSRAGGDRCYPVSR